MSHRRGRAGLWVVAVAVAGMPTLVWAQTESPASIAEKSVAAPATFPPVAAEAPKRVPAPKGNPAVRQEPSVTLEWFGPTQVQTGRPTDYTLCVRNVSPAPVQQVLVRVQLPPGARITETEPASGKEGDVIWWELGNLAPQEHKNVLVRMVPDTRGDLTCNAWVTFTGVSSMRVKISEPRLALKITPPEKAAIGEAATFLFTISNPGDGMAEQVKIHALLSEGLEHPAGRQIDFDVGNLPPREARTIRLVCLAKAGGEHKCEAVVDATGDLRVRERTCFTVTMPQLDVEVAGPKLRYLDRKAVYSLKVRNPGTGPAQNVMLSDVIPAGFRFQSATDGGMVDPNTRTVSWSLGDVEPGQMKEVKFEVLAVAPGEHQHRVTALAARGVKANSDMVTRVEGVSSLAVEVRDSDNPVEVGTEVCYEVRVINSGTKTENDIKLTAVVPDQMEFKNATGPARSKLQGKDIEFEPLPKLDPGADAIYRVTLTATAAGDARFKAKLISANINEPVVDMKSTRVYQD